VRVCWPVSWAMATFPPPCRNDYVLALVEVYLTNGHGVAWNAEPYYVDMIGNFSSRDAERALLSFTNTRIASRLQHSLCRQKFDDLLDMIEPKLARRRYKEIFSAVRNFFGPLDSLARDSKMKRLIKTLAG
jgi:hypothetical protein